MGGLYPVVHLSQNEEMFYINVRYSV